MADPMVLDNTLIMTLMYLSDRMSLVTLNTLKILRALKALNPLLPPELRKYSSILKVTRKASNMLILSLK